MDNVLEVEGLKKTYKNFCLNGVSFSIPANCVTGFIGTNGAGKTTTIRSMLGLTKIESGSIRVFGLDYEKHEQEIKDRIGVVLDDGSFYDELTMKEMKKIISSAYSSWDDNCYREYMERFALNQSQKIATLSKGMRMKFALVLALSHHADLLIMDEPTSGLDPLVRSQLLDLLLEFMRQENRSVFFSTHITSDLDKIADTLILINQGKIIFQEDKDILLETHRKIKGHPERISPDIKKLFISYSESEFGYCGITKEQKQLEELGAIEIEEKPLIEDVMLAYIGGKK